MGQQSMVRKGCWKKPLVWRAWSMSPDRFPTDRSVRVGNQKEQQSASSSVKFMLERFMYLFKSVSIPSFWAYSIFTQHHVAFIVFCFFGLPFPPSLGVSIRHSSQCFSVDHKEHFTSHLQVSQKDPGKQHIKVCPGGHSRLVNLSTGFLIDRSVRSGNQKEQHLQVAV